MRSLDRYAVRIHKAAGGATVACCPHCGLTLLAGAASGWYAVTPDALTAQVVNIRDGAFVMGSIIAPCCYPSVLCFLSPDHARRFADAFGGSVARFEEALDWTRLQMLGHLSHGAEKTAAVEPHARPDDRLQGNEGGA
jgi:hypothetical protein